MRPRTSCLVSRTAKAGPIGDWAPRLTFAGPIRKGRAWFSDSLDTQYVQTVIRDLPKGQDRYSSMRYGNLLMLR
jgi:hypothetical protein